LVISRNVMGLAFGLRVRQRDSSELSVLGFFLNYGTMAKIPGYLKIIPEQHKVSKRTLLYKGKLRRWVKCCLFEIKEELRSGICIGGFELHVFNL